MKNATTCLVIALFVSGAVWTVSAAEKGVGVVTANGQFRLDNSPVSGNATVFDGSLIETAASSSDVRLTDGPQIQLSPKTKVRIHKDRLVLELGMSDVGRAARYEIEAGDFRVAPASADSQARVVRTGESQVAVAALKGSVKVFNSGGLLLANVFPGTALSFEPGQGGAAPPSSFLGCLLKKNDKFVLYDQTTRIIIELRGSGFESEWGNRVQVVGTTDTTARSEIAAQVVDVSSVTRFGEGGCETVAAAITASLPQGVPQAPGTAPTAATTSAPGTAPPTSSGGGGGMSAGAKVAIVLVVAGGGGAAAAILATKSSDDRSRD